MIPGTDAQKVPPPADRSSFHFLKDRDAKKPKGFSLCILEGERRGRRARGEEVK